MMGYATMIRLVFLTRCLPNPGFAAIQGCVFWAPEEINAHRNCQIT